MLILKLNSRESAQQVAYMLRGKQLGQYLFLWKSDLAAITLAVNLSGGELLGQCSLELYLFVFLIVWIPVWLTGSPRIVIWSLPVVFLLFGGICLRGLELSDSNHVSKTNKS